MKNYLIVISFFVFSGFQCFETVEFDGSERILIKGRIVDATGKGIEGISSGYAPVVGYIEESGIGIANQDLTDQNGEFSFVVSNDNAEQAIININRPLYLHPSYKSLYSIPVNKNYQGLSYLVSDSIINNFELDLGSITLYDGVELSFECDPNIGNIRVDFYSDEKNYKAYNIDSYFPFCELNIDPIMVQKNSKLFMIYSIQSSTIFDTITIGDKPYKHIIKL